MRVGEGVLTLVLMGKLHYPVDIDRSLKLTKY
jgi:hypothetical protein